jgi:hypothetical protein
MIGLMIFQRLDANGSLSSAVCHLLSGPARELVREPEGAAAPSLSANTSSYSQARRKLPLEVAEQVSRLILESLQGAAADVAGAETTGVFTGRLHHFAPHSPALTKAYPPQRNQHGASHRLTTGQTQRVNLSRITSGATSKAFVWHCLAGNPAMLHSTYVECRSINRFARCACRSSTLSSAVPLVDSVDGTSQESNYPTPS